MGTLQSRAGEPGTHQASPRALRAYLGPGLLPAPPGLRTGCPGQSSHLPASPGCISDPFLQERKLRLRQVNELGHGCGIPSLRPQTPGWGLETSWLLEAAHLAPSRPPHEKWGPT